MQTFILYPVEAPSRIEEALRNLNTEKATDQTRGSRLERLAWLMKWSPMTTILVVLSLEGISIVRAIDNLDFTYQNPLRSIQQYIQVWLCPNSSLTIGVEVRLI